MLRLVRARRWRAFDAALGKVEAREDHAHFLGVVHAVKQHDGGATAAAGARHEIRRQARALVGHLDALDVGMEALHRGLISAQRLVVHRHLLGAGRDETLRAVVVVARTHVVVTGGDLATFRRGFVGDGGDAIRHRRPFLAPNLIEIGFTRTRLEQPPHAVDLVHGNGAVRCHALDDLHGIGPAQVAGKMHGPASWLRRRAVDHCLPPRARSPLKVGTWVAVPTLCAIDGCGDRQQ
jgi:hypothetical protein